MMSLGGNLTALACNPSKKVNKAEELTYLSTNESSSQKRVLKFTQKVL
jgi:hypothetical protein